MKVLLVNPPCGPRTIGMRYICRIEPLGLEQIGAAVSSEHETRLVDMQVRPADLQATLKEFVPDVAGVTSETVRVGPALDVLRTIRRAAPDCINVTGGHHPTVFPEDFNVPAVDLIALGEGFHTFGEICRTRAAGKRRFDHIAGLMIRTEYGLEPTETRPPLSSLDEMPPPDRSLTARYRRSYFYLLEPRVAMIRTSYGCRANCSFCPGALVYGRHYIPRDPKAMLDELCGIPESYIKFADNGSFHDADSMGKLGRMLVDARIKKQYYTFTRADAVVKNPDLFELWKRAGLEMAFLGIEALDDEVLKRMNKGASFTTMEKAISILEDLRIPMTAGFVIPPDAMPEHFTRIDEFIEGHPLIHFAEFTPLTPFPGTVFYNEQRENIITHDWEVYDLQHFVVKTKLPHEELYELMTRSYRKIVYRTIWRDHLWMPIKGLRQGKWRLLRGLLANGRALRQAHLHVQPDMAPPAARIAAGWR